MLVRVANDDAYEVTLPCGDSSIVVVRVSGRDVLSAGNDRRSVVAGLELMAKAVVDALKDAR